MFNKRANIDYEKELFVLLPGNGKYDLEYWNYMVLVPTTKDKKIYLLEYEMINGFEYTGRSFVFDTWKEAYNFVSGYLKAIEALFC